MVRGAGGESALTNTLSKNELRSPKNPSCFNARSRADNIPLEDLASLVAWLHRHGVRAYVTLNTLVFPNELERFEGVARQVAESGADAVLVQDLGAARLARAVCPDLPIHASTQMSLTSVEGIRAVESLGIDRVILARELPIDDIRAIRGQTRLALEVFVHGALCISYSGQCLASRTLGGRSANRGDCAQACRLPYQLVCDGKLVDVNDSVQFEEGIGRTVGNALGGVPLKRAYGGTPPRAFPTGASPRKYLLSPLDLAGYSLVPELIRAGVAALKIEGRLKSPEYVAAVTRHYRRAIDAAMAGQSPGYSAEELRQLEATFSRGFSLGWLRGSQPKTLVTGHNSSKRGERLGEVKRVVRGTVEVALSAPVKRGDGVVFDATEPDDASQGGRIFEVYLRGHRAATPVASGVVKLAFARGVIDWDRVRPGQVVWKTDDPAILRDLHKTYAGSKPVRTVPLDLVVEAAVGQPLRVSGRAGSGAWCEIQSAGSLVAAVKHPLSESVLREQLGRLGETPYELRRLEATIVGRPMVPLSVLGKLRRAMIAQLDASVVSPPRSLAAEPQLERLRAMIPGVGRDERSGLSDGRLPGEPVLHVLCRSPEQIGAALEAGVRSVIAEYRDIAACGEAVHTAHKRQAEILVATPRIQRPGETWVFEAIARHQPDGVLARNLAAMAFFAGEGLRVVADFSLNAANELTVAWLHDQGASRVTTSYDLSRSQLFDLVGAVPPEWLEVGIHLHLPMFHTEYCLWCAHLSAGTGRTNCGRPCGQHTLRLRDRKGAEHVVASDGLCRNTVYHAMPQSAAEPAPLLAERGVRHFRIELLAEQSGVETQRILDIYSGLLAGRVSCREAWRRLRALSPVGITRGTLR